MGIGKRRRMVRQSAAPLRVPRIPVLLVKVTPLVFPSEFLLYFWVLTNKFSMDLNILFCTFLHLFFGYHKQVNIVTCVIYVNVKENFQEN